MNRLLTICLQINLPDPWQILSWKVAIVTGLAAAILALVQAIAALAQRAREMRWKQAELARKLLDDVYDFDPSHNALIMVDEFAESFQLDNGQEIEVSFTDIDSALSTPVKDHSDKAKYIRRCFDALFYHVERIEQSIRIKLVKLEDVSRPAEYYVERLALHKRSIISYLAFTKYTGAKEFLERFCAWNDKSG